MSGVPVFEITATDGEIPTADTRLAIYQAIAQQFAENLLIFIDQDRNRSLWYWAKREGAKIYPRTEVYLKNQPADLILSKIGGLRIELEELDADGNLSVVDVAARLQRSLDVETVTKNFYKEFQAEHQHFIQHIRGIGQESDRRWYTSVVLICRIYLGRARQPAYINIRNAKSGQLEECLFVRTGNLTSSWIL